MISPESGLFGKTDLEWCLPGLSRLHIISLIFYVFISLFPASFLSSLASKTLFLLLMLMLTLRQQIQLFCTKCFVERINIWQKKFNNNISKMICALVLSPMKGRQRFQSSISFFKMVVCEQRFLKGTNAVLGKGKDKVYLRFRWDKIL